MKTSTSNQLRDLLHEVESELQGENAQPAQGGDALPDPSVKASRGGGPWHIALATVAICALFAGCAFAGFSSLPATEDATPLHALALSPGPEGTSVKKHKFAKLAKVETDVSKKQQPETATVQFGYVAGKRLNDLLKHGSASTAHAGNGSKGAKLAMMTPAELANYKKAQLAAKKAGFCKGAACTAQELAAWFQKTHAAATKEAHAAAAKDATAKTAAAAASTMTVELPLSTPQLAKVAVPILAAGSGSGSAAASGSGSGSGKPCPESVCGKEKTVQVKIPFLGTRSPAAKEIGVNEKVGKSGVPKKLVWQPYKNRQGKAVSKAIMEHVWVPITKKG